MLGFSCTFCKRLHFGHDVLRRDDISDCAENAGTCYSTNFQVNNYYSYEIPLRKGLFFLNDYVLQLFPARPYIFLKPFEKASAFIHMVSNESKKSLLCVHNGQRIGVLVRLKTATAPCRNFNKNFRYSFFVIGSSSLYFYETCRHLGVQSRQNTSYYYQLPDAPVFMTCNASWRLYCRVYSYDSG